MEIKRHNAGPIPVFKMPEKSADEFDRALDLIKNFYPRIYEMISLMWGERVLHEKLTNMIQADSYGREGFPFDIAMALMKIHDAHMTEFGFDAVDTLFGGLGKDQW